MYRGANLSRYALGMIVLVAPALSASQDQPAPSPLMRQPKAEVPISLIAPTDPSSRQNCGTFWTDWVDDTDVDINPCPKACERGERQVVSTHVDGDITRYAARYQCYQATQGEASESRARMPAADLTAGPQPLPTTPVGNLEPATGPWGELVRVEGENFARTESVRGMWVPADDTSTQPNMTQAITLYRREGSDALEIQIPADPATSGWSGKFSSGTLQILLFMPDESVIYVGEYTIADGNGRAKLDAPIDREIAFPPVAVTTSPLQMTGKRIAQLDMPINREIALPPVAVTTSPLQMTGKRIVRLDGPIDREVALPSVAVTTSPLRMTGKRLQPVRALTIRPEGDIGIPIQPPQ